MPPPLSAYWTPPHASPAPASSLLRARPPAPVLPPARAPRPRPASPARPRTHSACLYVVQTHTRRGGGRPHVALTASMGSAARAALPGAPCRRPGGCSPARDLGAAERRPSRHTQEPAVRSRDRRSSPPCAGLPPQAAQATTREAVPDTVVSQAGSRGHAPLRRPRRRGQVQGAGLHSQREGPTKAVHRARGGQALPDARVRQVRAGQELPLYCARRGETVSPPG